MNLVILYIMLQVCKMTSCHVSHFTLNKILSVIQSRRYQTCPRVLSGPFMSSAIGRSGERTTELLALWQGLHPQLSRPHHPKVLWRPSGCSVLPFILLTLATIRNTTSNSPKIIWMLSPIWLQAPPNPFTLYSTPHCIFWDSVISKILYTLK